MRASELSIHEIAPYLGDTRLGVRGDLDLVTAPLLERRLTQFHERGRAVVLNLSQVTFIDSSGVHVLVNAIKKATEDGWRFRIESDLRPQVRTVLATLDLARVLIDAL